MFIFCSLSGTAVIILFSVSITESGVADVKKSFSPSENDNTGNISAGERSSGLTRLKGTETDLIS